MIPLSTRVTHRITRLLTVPLAKLLNLVPLFKTGDAHVMYNYRPISLCSVVGKILERVVCKHLINHMYRGGIISPTQHRFLPKCSCVTQLTTLYHSWANALDVPKPFRIDAIFLVGLKHLIV